MLEQGFDAFIHADETGSRPIWRVRVGVFPQREQAAELQRTLREQLGLEGLLVSHP
ncbi:MAG: SPOR domain-containing protein [Wenzhouxiangella sp.]